MSRVQYSISTDYLISKEIKLLLYTFMCQLVVKLEAFLYL